MSDDFVVRTEHADKSYGRKRALADASITIKGGEIHVLLGKNGSGKTTLAKVLAGMLIPERGSVSSNGIGGGMDSILFRKQLGFLFDSSAHWDALTGKENATFFARSFDLAESETKAEVEDLFRRLSLDKSANDPVSTYSFGMRRKLAIVEALVPRPRLLIMDEPSIGLDFGSRAELYSILRARAIEGAAVLVATNDMNEARHIADNVTLMGNGRILATGTPQRLIEELDDSVMIQVEVPVQPPIGMIEALSGVIGVSATENKDVVILRVMTKALEEQRILGDLVGVLSSSGCHIDRIDVRRPELSDVFLKYTEGGPDAA